MSGVEQAPAASLLLPGAVLDGKYRVERVLGRGGMGLVLLARNLLLEERVAIKVLVGKSTPALRSRLLMEARAAARLQSDHVVRVFDVGYTHAGDPYLVMEYLAGEPLSEQIEHGGAQPVTQVVQWVLEACEGLAVAHCNGIVHRDLKPANLFWSQRPDGSRRLKVLDFGIAKLPAHEGLVTTAHPLGSPLYMAPEQLARGSGVDPRTDIWGLGVVLYEALTATAPFVAHDLLDLVSQLRDEAHVPVRVLRPDVPEALSRAIDRCLAKQREERWRDLVELARAIAPFGPADAPQALARIERIFAAGARAGATALGGETAVSGELALPAALGEAELVAATGEPELPAPALSMSLAGRAAEPRSRGRFGRWLARAALTAALGYLVGLWLDRRQPAGLLPQGLQLVAREREQTFTAAALARPLSASLSPRADGVVEGAVISSAASTAAFASSSGSGSAAVTAAPSKSAAPRMQRERAGNARGRSRTAGAVIRPAAPAAISPRETQRETDEVASRQAAAPFSAVAGPLPLDREVTW